MYLLFKRDLGPAVLHNFKFVLSIDLWRQWCVQITRLWRRAKELKRTISLISELISCLALVAQMLLSQVLLLIELLAWSRKLRRLVLLVGNIVRWHATSIRWWLFLLIWNRLGWLKVDDLRAAWYYLIRRVHIGIRDKTSLSCIIKLVDIRLWCGDRPVLIFSDRRDLCFVFGKLYLIGLLISWVDKASLSQKLKLLGELLVWNGVRASYVVSTSGI